MHRFAIVLMGLVMAGCATGSHGPATVDVTGNWSGLWRGYGVAEIRREAPVTAQLTQWGERLANTNMRSRIKRGEQ